jgi:hypothetical protein
MSRKELNDSIELYRAGFDDGFYVGLMSERDDIDTSHPSYRAGYDHGIYQYCETIEVAA